MNPPAGSRRLPDGGEAHDLGAAHISLPRLRQIPALLKQITAPIGFLDGIGDLVGQGHLPNLNWESGDLGAPVGERAAKAVRRQIGPTEPGAEHHGKGTRSAGR